MPTADEFFMKYQGPGADGNGWHRPVGMLNNNLLFFLFFCYLVGFLLCYYLVPIYLLKSATGLAWAKCQGVDCLLITSDATGVIIAMTSYSKCTW
jgi:hypothetical protein